MRDAIHRPQFLAVGQIDQSGCHLARRLAWGALRLRDTSRMVEDSVEGFGEGLRAAQRAFNQGDFESAFAWVAPDVEWHFGAWVIDGGVLHGREEVIRFYRRLREAGDWDIETVGFTDAGRGRMIVHQRGNWTGRTTKIGGPQDSFVIYEIGGDGLVARVREFASREEALTALESK